MQIAEAQLTAIAQILDNDERILAAWIFGSVASNRAQARSDLDIALMPEPGVKIGAQAQWQLVQNIAEISQRPVDVGILGSHNLVYARQVLVTGVCFYCRDQYRMQSRRLDLHSMYLNFARERQEVLDAYRAR